MLGSKSRKHLRDEARFVIQIAFERQEGVFEFQNGRSGEMHFPVGRGRQRSEEKITERRTGVRAAALPTADHKIALGNEIGSAQKLCKP